MALKTAILLGAIFLELVLRESEVGEHATSGVAESAMREVKRHTRKFKFALEAHVRKIVESHTPLEVDTDDDIRCNQFLQDWQRWLDS